MDVFLRCSGVLLPLVLQKYLYIKDVTEKEPETDPRDALMSKAPVLWHSQSSGKLRLYLVHIFMLLLAKISYG